MKNYTEKETIAFKNERRKATDAFKTKLKLRGKVIFHNYDSDIPAYKRGFTSSGSAILNFEGMRRRQTPINAIPISITVAEFRKKQAEILKEKRTVKKSSVKRVL